MLTEDVGLQSAEARRKRRLSEAIEANVGNVDVAAAMIEFSRSRLAQGAAWVLF